MTKKLVTAARYEEGTKTIRSVPENYWLASMDSWDSAVDHVASAKTLAASFEMLAALKECIAVYEVHRDNQPTGHLWPDPSHIFYARAAVAKAEA